MPSKFYEENWQSANAYVSKNPDALKVFNEHARFMNSTVIQGFWAFMMCESALASITVYLNERWITRWLCKPLIVFIEKFQRDLLREYKELSDAQVIPEREQVLADMVKLTESYHPSYASFAAMISLSKGADPYTDVAKSEGK
jgi:hypothetical protein